MHHGLRILGCRVLPHDRHPIPALRLLHTDQVGRYHVVDLGVKLLAQVVAMKQARGYYVHAPASEAST